MTPTRATPLLLIPFALAACTKADDTGATDAFSELSAALHDTIASLVYVSWEQLEPATVHVEFSGDGETWLQSPARQLEPGAQEELLLGIPYDSEGQYRLVVDAGDGPITTGTHTITTGAQPEGVPTLELLASNVEAWDPDTHWVLGSIDELNDLGVSVATWSFIFGRDGRVVWAWETPEQRATIHARVARTGTEFLLDYGSFWAIFDGGEASKIARLKIDGTEVALYDTPGLHHPFTDTPDGSLLWGAHNGSWNILRRLDPDGTMEDLWSCSELYDEIGYDDYGCSTNFST